MNFLWFCVTVVLLKGKSPIPLHIIMRETIMTMMILLYWMNDYSHEHTMNMMWKFYSHIDNSKVEMTFSPNESMSYYDVCLFKCLLHSLMNMGLRKKSIRILKDIMLSIEWTWAWEFFLHTNSWVPNKLISWDASLQVNSQSIYSKSPYPIIMCYHWYLSSRST